MVVQEPQVYGDWVFSSAVWRRPYGVSEGSMACLVLPVWSRVASSNVAEQVPRVVWDPMVESDSIDFPASSTAVEQLSEVFVGLRVSREWMA